MSVVQIWARCTLSNVAIKTVIRRIYFEAANNNFTLRITHISGVDNTLADAVSRFDNARFFENHPKANTEPIMVDSILDFLREMMLEPGNCSNSMQDRESSSVSDWLPLPEKATEVDLSDFALSV
ncbi:hypothetical protein RvY_03076 [Ramazzottius varieornatus]|uniref:Uncharacterized protein n=1 Tax=Ramazzottius varieornatus TaxID=947166 RepID=A0A1D1ULU5_RAMVA|nr:hypothetical protein RvY_03076 [Ramazzottius varieornatus]